MAAEAPLALRRMMAGRDHRMHHYLWHQVRNSWLFYDDLTRQRIRELGWEPPRPALQPASRGRRVPILDNASGEDFLYMHRQMIAAANAKLAEIGDASYPRVAGWSPVPPPGDAGHPVPPAWTSGDPDLDLYLAESKSDAFFSGTMRGWERDLTDSAKLRGMSLGELGARIEFTIHNRMHIRWCHQPAAMRPDPQSSNPTDIDTRWDDVAYDWLGDTYSSHVNSTFWKIHGWVDDRIAQWASANGVTGEIPWRGTWVGKMPGHPEPDSLHAMLAAGVGARMHDHEHDRGGEMERVAAVVARSGRIHHFYDPVDVPPIGPATSPVRSTPSAGGVPPVDAMLKRLAAAPGRGPDAVRAALGGGADPDAVTLDLAVEYDQVEHDLQVRFTAAVVNPKDEIVQLWAENARTGPMIPELRPAVRSVMEFSPGQAVRKVRAMLVDSKWSEKDDGEPYVAMVWGYVWRGGAAVPFGPVERPYKFKYR